MDSGTLLTIGLLADLTGGGLLLLAGLRAVSGKLRGDIKRAKSLFGRKKKAPEEKVNAIADYLAFKRERNARQVKEWEKAYLELCPPRPPSSYVWVDFGTKVKIDGYGNQFVYNDGYHQEDRTPIEMWEKEWLPWR